MPGPYDGYLTETQDGFEVGVNGGVIATYSDEADALAVLAEHAGDKPKWRVDRAGNATLIEGVGSRP
ncbi:MAG: hypothetical protein LC798_12835 [Chloroflexi bacterium]|nr:hypothetical protein [Chloroflexota bacterium]